MKVYILQEDFQEFIPESIWNEDGTIDDETIDRRNILGVFPTMDDLLKRLAEIIVTVKKEKKEGMHFYLSNDDEISGYEVSEGDLDTGEIDNISRLHFSNKLKEMMKELEST